MLGTTFARCDVNDIDALVTWAVIEGDHIVGRVSNYGEGDWHVTYAGLGVKVPHYCRFVSREAAAASIHDLREALGVERILPSGLTLLQEGVLKGETCVQNGKTTRDEVAAALGISPNNFTQVLFSLLGHERAKAFAPLTVAKAAAERERLRARRPGAQRRRQAQPAA